MASLAGIKDRVAALKPKVVPTFVVSKVADKYPDVEADDTIRLQWVRSGADPLLATVATGRRLAFARKKIDSGAWSVLVAIKDGHSIGWIWQTTATEHGWTSGIPRVKLKSPGERFLFDLWVQREFRRGNVAWLMGEEFFRDCSADPDFDYVYGFIAYDNVASIMWHHSVGFTIVQTCNMLHIGDSIKWRIPFSDMPRSGPLSRTGRHNNPEVVVFGPPLLP